MAGEMRCSQSIKECGCNVRYSVYDNARYCFANGNVQLKVVLAQFLESRTAKEARERNGASIVIRRGLMLRRFYLTDLIPFETDTLYAFPCFYF